MVKPGATDPTLRAQVVQLGADGELGGRPEDRVDIGVHDLDDPARDALVVEGYAVARGGVERAKGAADLVEPLLPVGDVVVEHREGGVDHRPVAGPDRGDL